MPSKTAADDCMRLRQDAWVCQQNIDHFRRQLGLATDPGQRLLLTELIVDEEERLEEIEEMELLAVSRPGATQ